MYVASWANIRLLRRRSAQTDRAIPVRIYRGKATYIIWLSFFRQAVEFGARAGLMLTEAESRAVRSGYCGRT